MKLTGLLTLLVLTLVLHDPVNAQEIDIDALLPPSMGGNTEVKSPSDVKIEDDVVTAATAQDAVNAAVKSFVEEVKESGIGFDSLPSAGTRWIQFPSGGGIVSTGLATFREMPNPTAGLVAQRNAYVIAYTNAKAELAKTRGGIANEGSTEYVNFQKLLITDDSTANSQGDALKRQVQQTATKALKGYVTYQWGEITSDENSTEHVVFVTLAITPKTMTESQRTGSVSRVDDLKMALKGVLKELEDGIVPPVGGRVITVANSGQTVFIGFGSAVIPQTADRLDLARNKINAQKKAEVYAIDALTGILNGDQTIWSTGVLDDGSAEYEKSTKYAIDNSEPDSAMETVTEAKQAFLQNDSMSEATTSTRKGMLPPGTTRQGAISKDGNWAYSICVYYADATAAAQEFNKAIDSVDLLSGAREPGQAGSSGAATAKSASGTSSDGEKGRRVDTRVPALPSGKLDDSDL